MRAIIVALFFAGQLAYAQQSEKGLKDVYANYFRIGTCYPSNQASNTQLQSVILREFNSLTHENELKPENTMVQSGSTDNDIKVQLGSNARTVMTFAQTNNIPIRGHTFVWHQQTPNWFFYKNMQNGELADKATMSKRMESYIKNMFALIAQEYPTLKLYAYDVVNEIFLDNGKQREPGDPSTNDEKSTWVKIYGNSSFVDSAFTYARKYAPAGCKLFYNDFNEYHPDGKRDSIVALYNRLKAKNVIDGIGMQSHLSTGWPDVGTYKAALNRFIATGAEIHVTELDLTIESGSDEAAQADKYKDVFKALKEAREEGANITSVSVWGVIDDWSWRNSKNPLLFKSTNFTKKPAYNQVEALIPEKDHGDGKNPPFNTPQPGEATGDENGYFFYHDFEGGTTQGWARRGDETVANSSNQKNSGSRSIYVSGRNQNWNGAQFTLPSEFKAGNEYSFSVMARHEGQGTITFKLSLQYDSTNGTTKYPNIVEVEAASGEWVQLSTTSYKLPPGTGFSIYVELDNANTSFYVDDAMGGIAGATINADGTPGTPPAKSSSSSEVATSSSSSSSSSEDGGDSSSSFDENSPIRLISNISKSEFSVSSLSNKSLLVETNSPTVVEIYDLKGNKAMTFNTLGGVQAVNLSLPYGVYFAKARGKQAVRFVLK
ncbi:MAG: endo-1,4-beta-xylanase [Candidatus Fibromonas sp.]|jgi:GH35 family endo-1,4-beta-xylanase|nr:endo-1,4-beta-xylanase [Candidatus Fibromonas sp.]